MTLELLVGMVIAFAIVYFRSENETLEDYADRQMGKK